VPSGPVYGLERVFSDPHVLSRDMLVELPHPALGVFKTTGLPLKWSATPTKIDRRPPLFAEHTRMVLRELGLTPDECAGLERAGVIEQRSETPPGDSYP
jgi:crotonobetainyl-CoA:carnitine CoA-transferase CaiB-like acyl-CoA transferase